MTLRRTNALDDLVGQIKQHVTDHDVLLSHFLAGTTTNYYEQLLKQAVEELMMIPARRVLEDLPVMEDADEAHAAIAEIAKTLSSLVDKTPEEVHQEMVARVQKFPFQDVQQSTALRKVNRLN